MKKYLFTMSAVAMLFATSCQNDIDMPQGAGETATVAFNISTPEIATRAYSDGTTATHLQYAVYKADGEILSDLTNINGEIHGSTTVDLKLTTGNKYTVVFWAAAPNAPYTVNFGGTLDAAKMDVTYTNATSNDENRDAFYAVKEFTVNGAMSVDVDLYRPFAQINIGTSDYAYSTSAGYTPTESAVTVKGLGTTLNFQSGTVLGEAEARFFAPADIKKDEKFPVEGYEYLAMNYVLVNNVKSLVDVEFTYTDGADAKTRIVGSVPVQRNYRTNIYGQLLTSDVDINVEIVPAYNEPDLEAEELYVVAACGGEVTLTKDVELPKSLIVADDISMIINLNGYNIINKSESADLEKGDGIIVYGDLTINGEGTVQGNTRAVWARGNTGAKVRINGGNYVGAVDGNMTEVIYASGNGVIDIYGGTFEAKTQDTNSFAAPQYAVLNLHGNGKDGCDINVYGGAFKNFNPADNISENPKHNFCAEGYTALEDGEWYNVISGAIVTNADEFKAAAANENLNYIVLGNDLDFGTAYITIGTDKTILGNGHKFIAGGKTTKNYALGVQQAVNVTIKDLVMNGGGGIYVSNGANVNVDNVILKIKYSASGRHLFYVNNATLTVNSGEFEVLNTGYHYLSLQNNARAYVRGGTWNDMMDRRNPVYTDTGAALEISGGKFQVNVPNYKFDPTPWLADGYKAERTGDYMEVSAE